MIALTFKSGAQSAPANAPAPAPAFAPAPLLATIQEPELFLEAAVVLFQQIFMNTFLFPIRTTGKRS